MSDKRRQRGRPKGTGINDWERLLTIASVMEKDPTLKVTTAIKQLGFTDPSVIRRLRDKFKANQKILARPRSRTPGQRRPIAGSNVTDREAKAEPAKPCAKRSYASAEPKLPETIDSQNDNQVMSIGEIFFGTCFSNCFVYGVSSVAILSNLQAMAISRWLSDPASQAVFAQQALVSEICSAGLGRRLSSNTP